MKNLFKKIWSSIKEQLTTQDIIILIIITFLMVWVFVGCEQTSALGIKNSGNNSIDNQHSTYSYLGCEYLQYAAYNVGACMVHLPTCNNPKHRVDTIVIKEIVEFK